MPKALEIGIEIFARFVEGYCLWLLFSKFGEARGKMKFAAKRGEKGSIGFLTVVLWMFLGKIVSLISFSGASATFANSMLNLVLRAVVAYGIGSCLYRMKRGVRLFLVLLFLSCSYSSIQIGKGVGAFLLYAVNQMAMQFDALNRPELVSFVVKAIFFTEDLLAIALIFLSARFLTKHYKYSLNEKSAKEMISYMLPAVTGCLASVVLYFVMLLVNENGGFTNYEAFWGSYVLVMVVAVAIWLAVIYSFTLQQELIGLQEERLQQGVLENQISQLQNSMAELELFYEGVRRVKHDMKNQMAVLERLLKESPERADGEVFRYFEDMQGTLCYLEQKIHTGNAVGDAVVGSKFHSAAKEIEGIRLEEELLLPENLGVRAYDIGIILNNGLDNAIEACKRQRERYPEKELYIKLRSFWRKNMFFIEIENSFDGTLLWGADGIPVSEKTDGCMHGLGLKNIRSCAKKYGGELECIATDGKFILSVMLKGKE